jgi:hypothetical protein
MLKDMSSEIMDCEEFTNFCTDKMCDLDGVVHYHDTVWDISRDIMNRQFYNEAGEEINILFSRKISNVDGEVTFEVYFNI